jgi:DNA-binding LacI/PurR family transcriptional regulator
MVRIKDVAEHAGVSTATVSRVINGKSVKPRYREDVERSVKELGYRSNPQAIATGGRLGLKREQARPVTLFASGPRRVHQAR